MIVRADGKDSGCTTPAAVPHGRPTIVTWSPDGSPWPPATWVAPRGLHGRPDGEWTLRMRGYSALAWQPIIE